MAPHSWDFRLPVNLGETRPPLLPLRRNLGQFGGGDSVPVRSCHVSGVNGGRAVQQVATAAAGGLGRVAPAASLGRLPIAARAANGVDLELVVGVASCSG